MTDLTETYKDPHAPHDEIPLGLPENPDGSYSRSVRVTSKSIIYAVQGSGSNINTTGSFSGSAPTGFPCIFAYVSVHLSGSSAAENFVIKLDAYSGSAFDAVLSTYAMSGLSDYVYYPGFYMLCQGGDAIVVSYKNSNARGYGIQIVFERLG